MAGNSWIQPLGPTSGAAARLFCLPHAGGAASFFRPLAAGLAGPVEVLGVQYPGRQARFVEPPLTSLVDLADQVAAALAPRLDLPFALFGHSMGALLAYEVALRLERDGSAPRWLFASGHGAPSRPTGPPTYQLDDDGLVAELHRLNGTELAVLDDPDLIEIILPVFRADLTAVQTYRPSAGAPLRCPVTVLLGDADPTTTIEDARAWAAHAAGPHEVIVLPGGHFYLTAQWPRVISAVAGRMAGDAG